MNPKVLLVNHADGGGGAAVAAHRLHVALRRAGVDSSMLVGTKTSHDVWISQLRQWRMVRRPIRAVTDRLGLNELDGIGAYTVGRRDDFEAADIVHYHAIHGSWFSYPVMPLLTRQKPSVMTLHDMWAFTGHCTFSFECGRWQSGCGHCPHPEAFPSIRRDATAVEWKFKDRVWSGSRLTIVSPSEWLAALARRSMLGRFPVTVIPHGIDTEVFRRIDPVAARTALRLPLDDPIVLFAASSVADRRKGADLVTSTLKGLPEPLRKRTTVALLGDGGPQMAAQLGETGCLVADLGYVASDRLKAVIYSAADVFVFPTRADNSPLVVLESLACGTPVASFDVGGVNELVHAGVTGLLAEPEDVVDLAVQLRRLLEDADLRGRLGDQARQTVVREFPQDLAADRHRQLYAELLGEAG
jgi:glycosyltransferase involved in cell wall biosynthesis